MDFNIVKKIAKKHRYVLYYDENNNNYKIRNNNSSKKFNNLNDVVLFFEQEDEKRRKDFEEIECIKKDLKKVIIYPAYGEWVDSFVLDYIEHNKNCTIEKISMSEEFENIYIEKYMSLNENLYNDDIVYCDCIDDLMYDYDFRDLINIAVKKLNISIKQYDYENEM